LNPSFVNDSGAVHKLFKNPKTRTTKGFVNVFPSSTPSEKAANFEQNSVNCDDCLLCFIFDISSNFISFQQKKFKHSSGRHEDVGAVRWLYGCVQGESGSLKLCCGELHCRAASSRKKWLWGNVVVRSAALNLLK
jgi:hypothetical protein